MKFFLKPGFLPHSAIFSFATFFLQRRRKPSEEETSLPRKKRVCTLQKIKGALFGIMQKPPRIF